MGYCFFFTCIKDLICGGVIYTSIKILFFFIFVALKWLNTSIETLQLKFDSIWTSIIHKLTSIWRQCAGKNTLHILEIRVCLATKIRS